ncbi:AMP-binding protein [Streptomyces melanosporofaciens]|uniref:Fatty-acyl-CoA synthase n=1 Tax=Streptomyces melanosporofaciens TaxID=67327 RepID=A0A1H4KMP9_STRMJ|nr:AMP-binding protein [Streptomyces melanosporofaciens]SEB59663.1 fatty-acyl-CoA synthase [Streptomyces melanosporofaciens]
MLFASDPTTALRAGRRLSLALQLARTARRTPTAPVLRYEGRELNYASLDARVNQLARAYAERGVRYGDRVAVLMNNRLEVVEAWFAALRLGAVAVPVNFRLVAAEVAHVISDCSPSLLVVEERLAETALEGRRIAGSDCPVLHLGPGDAAPAGTEDYTAALAATSDACVVVDVPESDPAFLMYSSGTTGRSKGAVLTHLNLMANAANSAESQPILPTDRGLLNVPMFHIAGVDTLVNHLLAGACTVLGGTGGFDSVKVVDLLERERITSCYLVPSQWKAICEVPGIRDRKLALRSLGWGSSVAPPSVLEAMNETFPGVPIRSVFGQTEMSAVTCVLGGDDAVRKLGSVGKPVRHVDARIVDEAMQDVPVGEVGEIVYRGANLMQGYWNNPGATAEAFAGGWFHSGDLCRMDDEGYIYVVDRKKNMIVSGGENIYSAEVEAAIDSHPKVAEVAVVGIPHPRWVETPRAYVVPSDPADPPTEDEIIDHCRARLASYKKPTSVVVLDVLPRNAAGKVLKIRLRESARG